MPHESIVNLRAGTLQLQEIPIAYLWTDGWRMLPAADQYHRALMRASGLVYPSGATVASAKVLAITGGTSPHLKVRDGLTVAGTQVGDVAATADAELTAQVCSTGVFIEITGSPTSIVVLVKYS